MKNIKFKNNQDMLNAFYSYFNERDAMPLWKTRSKFFDTELVKQPPSLWKFYQWLRKCELEPWDKISYKNFQFCFQNEKYQDAATEILTVIEDDVIMNALAGNYQTNFSQKFLQQKYGWENQVMDDSKVLIVGVDGVRKALEQELND